MNCQIINKEKCNMKQLCGPEAWKEFGGGLTYRFVEDYVKPNLIAMCVEGGAESTDVEFEYASLVCLRLKLLMFR